MAKKKINVVINVDNERDFDRIIRKNENKLICAEIYDSFAGPCLALDRFFLRMKLDWSEGKMIVLRVQADDIEVLSRFRGHSEPMFIFILNQRITQVVRGVDAIKFEEIAKREIYLSNLEEPVVRNTYALDEASPEETVKFTLFDAWALSFDHELEHEASVQLARRATWQAARKRHRAEQLVPYLQDLNFVVFWPHCKHAHPELYERWDINDIIMVGREEPQLSAQAAADVLYAGDAPTNEASMHALTAAPALVICFRLLQDNVHFVSLVRRILYEDVPTLDDGKPTADRPLRTTAYDFYKTFSKSKEQILEERRRDREKRKLDAQERRVRRLSEMQRLARQAVLDALQHKRQMKEERKLELLRTEQLEELKILKEEPDDDEVSIVIPEELEELSDEEGSEEEDPEEYFPPAGQLVPGFYSPPNDIAKVNGLAVLFPKLVSERVVPLDEFLPPLVVVILAINKRYKVIESMQKYKKNIIHMGIFKGSGPYDSSHVAYSVKQFDAMKLNEDNIDEYKLMLMVSVERDAALLELMESGPLHVSRDPHVGEDEAHQLFPVNYSDNHNDLEDFN